MRVLYLEDSEPDIKFMRKYMNSLNWQFMATSEVDEAQRYLEQHRPDVFLVDIVINGEVVDDLISVAAKQKLSKHIVAITARALPEECERYLELGCEHVIAKPFTIDDLDNALNQIV